MGLGTGALVGFNQDHHIEWIGEFFMPHLKLIDRRMNRAGYRGGLGKALGQVRIVEFAPILAPRSAPGVRPVIGQIQRGIVTPL